jgi:hypothetical protein
MKRKSIGSGIQSLLDCGRTKMLAASSKSSQARLRMDLPKAAIWSPVPSQKDCPVKCFASWSLMDIDPRAEQLKASGLKSAWGE